MKDSYFLSIMAMLFFIASSVNDHNIGLLIVAVFYVIIYIISCIFEFMNDKNK